MRNQRSPDNPERSIALILLSAVSYLLGQQVATFKYVDLTANDKNRLVQRREVASKYRAFQTVSEVKSASLSRLSSPIGSTREAYSQMLTLYYWTLRSGRSDTAPYLRSRWSSILKYADLHSAEYARAVLDLCGACREGSYDAKQSANLVARFADQSDVLMLAGGAVDAGTRAKQVPSLIQVAEILVRRSKSLKRSEIIDYVGTEPTAGAHLLFLAGVGFDVAGFLAKDRNSAIRAMQCYDEVAQRPGAPDSLVTKARRFRQITSGYNFVKASD